MPPAPSARPPLAPALAVAALVFGLIVQAIVPLATPLPDIPPSRAQSVLTTAAAPLPMVAASAIAQRTLFSPSRRIDPAAVAGPSLPGGIVLADPFLGATLVGTARARGVAIAVVRDAAGKVHSLRPGARLGAWRVLSIAQGGATFGNGGTRRVLAVGETAAVQAAAAQTQDDVEHP